IPHTIGRGYPLNKPENLGGAAHDTPSVPPAIASPQAFVAFDSDQIRSNRFFAALACTDAHCFLDRHDKDLSVADAPCFGALLDGLENLANQPVGNHDLDLHLRHEVDHVGRAPVDLLLAARTTETLDFGDGHSLDSDLGECILHLVELEWLDDRLDFFHG